MKKTLRILLTVLLTAVMLLCTLSAAAIWSVRSAYTSERIYDRMNSVSWASVALTYNNETMTLCEIYNQELGTYLGEMTEEEFDSVVYYFSIDTIVTSFVQDLRAWAFDYAPAPTLDPRELASTVLSRIDGTLLQYLSIFGDPEELLTGVMGRITENADIEDLLTSYEDIRIFFSDTALYITASAAAVLFLFILLLNSLRFSTALMSAGICCVITGLLLASVHPVLSLLLPAALAKTGIPLSTFNIIYTLLSVKLSQNGMAAFLIGLGAILLSALTKLSGKRKAGKTPALPPASNSREST